MATQRISLHHDYRPSVSLEPINPVYENRMYISGFLGFIGTQYKKEMVSSDGYEEVWYCEKCGRKGDDLLHKPEIISHNTI